MVTDAPTDPDLWVYCSCPSDIKCNCDGSACDEHAAAHPIAHKRAHAEAMRVHLLHRADAGRVRHVPLPVPARQP